MAATTLQVGIRFTPLGIDIMENMTLRTTVQFLDMLREHFKYLSEDGKTPATDYRVAKVMGWNHATISNYRTGKRQFDDQTCLQVADTLNLHREHVLGCIHYERSKASIMRDFWKGVALARPNPVKRGSAGK